MGKDLADLVTRLHCRFCRCHLHFAENSVELIETIAKDAFGELVEEGALSSKLYPTLRRYSIHTVFFLEP